MLMRRSTAAPANRGATGCNSLAAATLAILADLAAM
jgi:hypothetical protein